MSYHIWILFLGIPRPWDLFAMSAFSRFAFSESGSWFWCKALSGSGFCFRATDIEARGFRVGQSLRTSCFPL